MQRSKRWLSGLFGVAILAVCAPSIRADAELAVLEGHKGGIRSIAFTADGKSLVSLGKEDGKVLVWSPQTHKQKAVLNNRGALRMRMATDGKMLAVSSSDYAVTLWNLSSFKAAKVLKGHTSRVYHLRFTPDGKRLATADETHVVKVWDVATGRELVTIKPHADVINDIAFSGNGDLLVTTSRDRTVKVWNARTGKRVRTIAVERGPLSIEMPNEGKLLVGTDGATLRTWDLATGKELGKIGLHTGAVYVSTYPCCMIQRDQKTVAVMNGWSEVRLVDLEGVRQRAMVSHDTALLNFALCPKERLLAGAGNDGAVRLWDISAASKGKPRVLATLKEHTKAVTGIIFSPDGKILASCSEDGTLRLWDVARAMSNE